MPQALNGSSPPPLELALVAAVARNGAIGRAGVMPWHLPQDLAHFRRVTMNSPVIMGRKTWESLPARFKPLPGRRNIVVTRNPQWSADGAEATPSIEAALMLLGDAPRAFVIGGGELYRQALPLADRLVLTEIDASIDDADTFFPAWDRTAFLETAREAHPDATPFGYAFVTYQRAG